MKKMLPLIVGIVGLIAVSASADPSIFNGYAYVSDTTAGTGSTWYNLSGTAQATSLDAAPLGDFESNMWLGGQTGFYSEGNGVEHITMHYSISGDATASGSISYAFESYTDPNDQWGTDSGTDSSVDLIATHSLGIGDYNLAVWVEGKPNNLAAQWDSNNSANYNATFGVIPEPATMGLALLTGIGMLFIRRIFMM